MTHEENNETFPVDEATDPASKPKQPYSSPRLTVYGDARELTQAVGSKGMGDGVGGRKTGF